MIGAENDAWEREASAVMPFLLERMDATGVDADTMADCALDRELHGLTVVLVELVDAVELTAERAASSGPGGGGCTPGAPRHPQADHQLMNAMLGEVERQLRQRLTVLVPDGGRSGAE